jgi:hypothetical protein
VSQVGDAIPDSEANQKLVHRWYLSEDTAPFVDQIGNDDGENNGTVQVTGNWAGGAARESNGTGYITTGTLGNFGSLLDSDVAVAYSIQTTDSQATVLGLRESDNTTFLLNIGDGAFSRGTTGGHPSVLLSDTATNLMTVEADTAINDGNPHRVVMNKTGSGASSVEWYVDGSATTTTIHDSSFTSIDDFQIAVKLFAENKQGSERSIINAIEDDICFFDQSLTSTEATSYNAPF